MALTYWSPVARGKHCRLLKRGQSIPETLHLQQDVSGKGERGGLAPVIPDRTVQALGGLVGLDRFVKPSPPLQGHPEIVQRPGPGHWASFASRWICAASCRVVIASSSCPHFMRAPPKLVTNATPSLYRAPISR